MKIRRAFAFASALSLAALSLAACTSQVDPTYQGEPLATVQGSVDGDGSSPASSVVLIWDVNDHPLDLVGTTAPITDQFPAGFTMPLYTPPPDDALIVATETGTDAVGVAYIVVAKAGTSEGKILDGDQLVSDMLGMSEDHVVVYLDHALMTGSKWEPLLGGRPSAGYHLMDVVRKTPAEKQAVQDCNDQYQTTLQACDDACVDTDPGYDACLQACDVQNPYPSCGDVRDTFRESSAGFDTAITVHLGPISPGINWY
jgi:hypothetical protein